MAIVTTTYRYKPPPKRKGRKLAEITGPAVVTSKEKQPPPDCPQGGGRSWGWSASPRRRTPVQRRNNLRTTTASQDIFPTLGKRGRRSSPRATASWNVADDYHGLPTPRTTLAASYVVVLVWCKGGCRH